MWNRTSWVWQQLQPDADIDREGLMIGVRDILTGSRFPALPS